MIGMSCGAKNNKSTGYFKSIDWYLKPKSITLEVGPNYAGRICWTKTSRSINEDLKSKDTRKNPTSMIFFQLLFSCPANTSYFLKSLRDINTTKGKPSGSWNLYILLNYRHPSAKEKESLYSTKSTKFQNGKLPPRNQMLKIMSANAISSTQCSLEAENSIWESMRYALPINH